MLQNQKWTTVALILFEHLRSLNWIHHQSLVSVMSQKARIMCTCLHQYGSLVKSEVLNHCLFKPLSLPCLERWCRCHDPTGHGDSVHAPFFFSWHNHYCSIHRSVFSFTVSGRCSLHFLVKLSFWGFCFICVLLFFTFVFTVLWICLCLFPLHSLS